eukprot:1580343-Alexandrium_andersonii.AAC.1
MSLANAFCVPPPRPSATKVTVEVPVQVVLAWGGFPPTHGRVRGGSAVESPQCSSPWRFRLPLMK